MFIVRVRFIFWVIKYINVFNIDYINYFYYGLKLVILVFCFVFVLWKLVNFYVVFMVMVKNVFVKLLVFFYWYRFWCWVYF